MKRDALVDNLVHNNNYTPSLTSLRGIAAILVALFHLNEIVICFVSPGDTQFLRHGYLFVDLFFILSGFVICYVYYPKFAADPHRGMYFQFLKGLIARIY